MKFKFLVFSVLISAFTHNLYAQNDWEKAGLKGKVKSIEEISYRAIYKNGQILKGKRQRPDPYGDQDYYKVFNKKGNVVLIDSDYLEDKDKYRVHKTYEYDDNNHLIALNSTILMRTFEDTYRTVRYKHTYKYDKNGNLIEEKSFKNDSPDYGYKTSYEYDENGNLIKKIEEKIRYGNKYIERVVEYKYNNNNDRTEAIYNNKFKQRHSYRYDNRHNMIEYITHSPNGQANSSFYIYDKHNNLIKEKSDIYTTKYRYDDSHNLIESTVYKTADQSFVGKSVLKYDEKGNLIEKCDYEISTESESVEQADETPPATDTHKLCYKYEYDTRNNFIKKYISWDDKTKYLIERKIEYYK